MGLTFIERFLQMFQFQGWFFHDLSMTIAYALCFLVVLSFIRGLYVQTQHSKQEDALDKTSKKGIPLSFRVVSQSFLIILILACAGFLFSGGASRNNTYVNAYGGTVKEGNQVLVINKIRRDVFSGKDQVYTTYTPHLQINAVDITSGAIVWSKRSNMQEEILGESTDGVVVFHKKKKSFRVLSKKIGEVLLTSKELEQNTKALKNNWSDNKDDYRVYGDFLLACTLDGTYYQINLSNGEVQENQKTNALFVSQQSEELKTQVKAILGVTLSQNESVTPQVSVPDVEEALSSELFNATILGYVAEEPATQAGRVFVWHTRTRSKDSQWLLSAVDVTKKQLLWEVKLPKNTGDDTAYMRVNDSRQIGNLFLFYDNGYLYTIDVTSGKLALAYDYAYNRDDTTRIKAAQ